MVDEQDSSAETVHSEGQAPSGSVAVVVVRVESSRAGERMVASLGRSFRREARGGRASAFVVTRGKDGSLELVQSRVVTASGLVGAVIGVTAATLAGLMGLRSALRGAKAVGHGARERQSGVGRDDERLASMFDHLSPDAAYVLFVCTDEQTKASVVARGGERGSHTSQHSEAEVLAMVDRLGSDYDWIRPMVTDPATKASKKRGSTDAAGT